MTETLLHCCCAPCSSAIIEWMMQHDVRPTLYYCNPNIYPEEEYMIRKNELTRYAKELGLRVIDDDHLPEWEGWELYHKGWLDAICGLEHEPERGKRCLKCFKIRLLRAAEIAKKEGFEIFTTTLASSRWKSLDQINEAGLWAAEQVNNAAKTEQEKVTFDTHNWRKGGLQERRNQLLKEIGFYNQLYCGCEFSLEAMKKKFAGNECCGKETPSQSNMPE
ncbi:epoxyqueuosine reductase QueH [Prevotella sp. PINT]|uniref:epoxyqueuosine reductase QueH n=1 Tax=Palleniella intestinalis TaxID=2736291 RepID=UPI0015561C40|nr:epoxyqueuosine reductase QueH [Palleniella intestinalis]NPD80856.1 epoxyqueuosine reductase QueH [Palleniella intestinalis]